MKSFRSFFTLHVTALVLAGLLGMAVAAWLGFWLVNRRAMEGRSQETLAHTSHDVSALVDGVQGAAEDVERLWRGGHLQPGNPARAEADRALLTDFMAGKPTLNAVAVLNQEGRGLFLRRASDGGIQTQSFQPSGPDQDPMAAEGWFNTASKARRPHWTSLEWFSPDVPPGLAYLLPVFKDGHQTGVVRIEITVTQMASRLWRTQGQDSVRTLVTDDRHRILVRPHPGDSALDSGWQDFGRPLSTGTLPLFHRARLKMGSSQSLTRLREGTQTFTVARMPLPQPEGKGWMLYVALPESGFWLGNPAIHLLILLGTAALLALGFAWRMHRMASGLERHLRELQDAAQVLAKGRVPSPIRHSLLECQALGETLVQVGCALERDRQVQSQLETAERMRIMGTLAGGIAHDINNQLAAMIGQINLGKGYLEDGHPTLERMERAEEAAGRCAHMIRSLMGFGRKTQLVVGPVDLNALVQQAAKGLERSLSSVDLRLRLDPRIPQALGNLVNLEQILLNLAHNALDAMPDGGTLTLTTDRISADRVMISVSDTGKGMSPEVRAHIFEPFFTTKEVGKGTGLGLALVYGIVHSHEGEIEVDSLPGRGSSFRIYLPAFKPASREVPSDPSRMGILKGQRVLIVEDEPTLRDLLEDALTQEKAVVSTAADGAQGWAIWSQGDFDLLITDHRMPRMTGLELVRKVRERQPEALVIMASGFGLEGQESALAQDPWLRLAPKPFAFNSLIRMAADLLHQRGPLWKPRSLATTS